MITTALVNMLKYLSLYLKQGNLAPSIDAPRAKGSNYNSNFSIVAVALLHRLVCHLASNKHKNPPANRVCRGICFRNIGLQLSTFFITDIHHFYNNFYIVV